MTKTFFDQFSTEQMRKQYATNAEILGDMVKKAEKLGGKKYRGVTLAELKETHANFIHKSLTYTKP